MIKLINCGSFYSALNRVIDFCKEHNNERVEIVVPDKLSLFMERYIFEHMSISASFNIKVSTLNRFAKKSCDVPKEKMISKVGSIILIHKILNEHILEFAVLRNNAYSFTYAEEIFNTIGQLKASKISVDEMIAFDSESEQLKDKIHDLALVYQYYEQEKAGLLDASDLFLMSAFSVAKGKENSNIFMIGFDDFTSIEYTIIERLASIANVNIINYRSKGNNRHIFNHEMYDRLKNIAIVNEYDFKLEDYDDKQISGLKRFLQDNLFGIKNEKFELDNEVIKLFSANKASEEIEFIARDIRAKILYGKHYNNFSVAVFGLDNYIDQIKEIFTKYEINYYIDSSFSLNKSVFYKFLLSIIKFNLEIDNTSHLIDIVNSPFFIMNNEDKHYLTNRIYAYNFKGKNLRSIIVEEGKQNILNELISFIDLFNFDRNTKIEKFISILNQAEEKLHMREIIESLASEKVDLTERILLTKSSETIFDLLDEISKFYPNSNMDIVYDIFSHVSNIVTINNLPLTLDAVKIVEADDSLEVFDHLYIANCTSESAPSLKYDCGIILDSEIETLNFKYKLSPTIAFLNRLKKLRVYNLALTFNKSLTITYTRNESDLVRELKNKIIINIAGKRYNLIPVSMIAQNGYLALSESDYIENFVKYNKNAIKKDDIGLKRREIKNISAKNLIIFDDKNVISASQLENYFKCPFYYFLNNTMKIRPRNRNEIQSLDVGNILHEILYIYYKRNKTVGDIYEFCRDEVYSILERDERLKMNASSPMVKNIIDEAVRVINGLTYIDENSAFMPRYFEYEFFDKTRLDLKNISLIGKVDRIDEYQDTLRIIDYKSGKADASLKELYYGNKLQLFLYALAVEQTLKKEVVGVFYLPLHNIYTREIASNYSLKGFYKNDHDIILAMDTRLQPGVKSDIVNIKMNKSGTARKTIGYKELSQSELSTLKDYSRRVSERAVDEIKSGYISPSPSEISNMCDYCLYAHICMHDASNIQYRAVDKVNLSSFKEVNDG